ncbi:MAG: sugar ABC transporter ATP-binding protein [Clostridiales bacterium]|jgi:ABC-type sugar transport system ATPase subunit|nr:sugar ABC transporter ATP-binding protein [Clostridiales bacterium]
MADYILEMRGITKVFPGVRALDDVSINVERGTVHALVGENGAGKSTLIKVLAGIYHPEEGEVYLDGVKTVFRTPNDSQHKGISVVHQEFKMSETLSVAENVFLGNLMYKGRVVDWKGMRVCADKMLRDLGVPMDVDVAVETLSVAQKQMVEICKAINRNCKVLIMDEPSATLTEKEQMLMFDTVRKLKASGVTVIYISHRMEEIFDLCDNVSVLRDGQHIATVPVASVTRDELVSLMVGRTVTNEYPRSSVQPGEVILEGRNITRKGVLHDISFQLRKGEVLGIAGLVGAGRTELARAILGIDKIDSGELLLHGKPVKMDSFRKAIANGLSLVPEDRKTQGLVQIATVSRNINMVNMDAAAHGFVMDDAKERKISAEYVQKLDISTPSVDTEAQYLSGGNQQKVVIAKWLLEDSEIVILDEPTRGIDVGAKSEIHNLIVSLVEQGKSVLMISSELPEVIGMSDRILVIHEGHLVGELHRGEASQKRIMSLCV